MKVYLLALTLCAIMVLCLADRNVCSSKRMKPSYCSDQNVRRACKHVCEKAAKEGIKKNGKGCPYGNSRIESFCLSRMRQLEHETDCVQFCNPESDIRKACCVTCNKKCKKFKKQGIYTQLRELLEKLE